MMMVTNGRSTLARLATALALAVALLAASHAGAQCADGVQCELVWSDEFDGTGLDLSKWTHQIGTGCPNLCGWGNNELQFYTATATTVADGLLTITADNQGGNYTSARIRTLDKGDWTYGRFEMRAKLPEGQGMWPAFWLLPSDPNIYGVWAASGEIDVMESIGSDPGRILGSLHYGDSFPGNVYDTSTLRAPAASVTDDFRVYAVEWQEDEIRWYVDDQLYATRNLWWSTGGPYPAPFDVDFHLLLNLAVGGNLPGNPDGSTVFPQEYVIDYVRVYELPAAQSYKTALVFDEMEHGDPFGSGYFQFNGSVGGGGIGASTDVPPGGGAYAIETGWGSGGTPGFYGGFGREYRLDLSNVTEFSFWINPDAGQSYTLEINLQDDDNGDGQAQNPSDDEFQYNCVVSPTGPCAVSGGGWQEVRVPLSAFFDDNSFLFGGNGTLDALRDVNGTLVGVVWAVIGNGGAVTFRSDRWAFRRADSDGDGVSDLFDNCRHTANPGQRDTDSDGYGNACDADLSGDCVVNVTDLGLLRAVFFTDDADADFNGDGVVNAQDLGVLRDRFFAAPGPSAGGNCPSATAPKLD